MRRILALAATVFAAFGTTTASAGTYTFNVQLTVQQLWTDNYNSYTATPLSDTFTYTLTTDPSQRTASTDPSGPLGGTSIGSEPQVSQSGTPNTAALQAYLGPGPYFGTNFARGLSYASMGTQADFLITQNNGSSVYSIELYSDFAGGFVDFTAPGAFDSYMASLVGQNFYFTELGFDNSGETLYRGYATLVSTDVPEPHAMLVIGAGLLAAGTLRRRSATA